MASQDTLTLLRRVDCHLCEETAALLGRLGVSFATIDVDSDAVLTDRYGDAIPVLMLGDSEVCRAPISEPALKAALRQAGIAAGS